MLVTKWMRQNNSVSCLFLLSTNFVNEVTLAPCANVEPFPSALQKLEGHRKETAGRI